jgi:hypothetical protein
MSSSLTCTSEHELSSKVSGRSGRLNSMIKDCKKSGGSLVAKALRGAWRESPPPFALTAVELADISPLLYSTGTGALVWRTVRESALKNTSAAGTLRQAHRLQVLEAARSERDIRAAFKELRSARIEPLMFKGWAAARHYPERGLRPWGDIDLYVPPREYERAEKVVQGSLALRCAVDLYHADFADLDERGVEELYARSLLVPLGDVEVRVPGEVDHLRLLCLHWRRHHGWRPLWLCDIAAALEGRRAGFDWNVCLRGTERQRDWIVCALLLARELLGAQVGDAPDAIREARAPRWLMRAVLKQWGVTAKQHRPDNLPMLTLMRRRAGIIKALRDRWPNAVEATYEARRSPFSRMPRLPSQFGLYLVRAFSFQARLPRLLREGSSETR